MRKGFGGTIIGAVQGIEGNHAGNHPGFPSHMPQTCRCLHRVIETQMALAKMSRQQASPNFMHEIDKSATSDLVEHAQANVRWKPPDRHRSNSLRRPSKAAAFTDSSLATAPLKCAHTPGNNKSALRSPSDGAFSRSGFRSPSVPPCKQTHCSKLLVPVWGQGLLC